MRGARRRAGTVYLLGVVLFAALTIPPLDHRNPLWRSRVSAAPPDGLTLEAPSLVVATSLPARLDAPPFRRGEFAIELVIRPTVGSNLRQGVVVGDTCDALLQRWTLEQRGTHVTVRLGGRRTKFRDVLVAGQSARVLVVFERERAVLYRDGEQVASRRLAGERREWREDCRLTIGNTQTGELPWLGELRGLQIYDRLLDADQARALARPDSCAALPGPALPAPLLRLSVADDRQLRLLGPNGDVIPLAPVSWVFSIKLGRLLTTSYRDRHGTAGDALRNAVATIPLGLAFAWWRRRDGRRWSRVLLGAALAQALLSLTVETTQLFSDDRWAEPVDVATNVVGAVLGAALACATESRPRQGRASAGRRPLARAYTDAMRRQDPSRRGAGSRLVPHRRARLATLGWRSGPWREQA